MSLDGSIPSPEPPNASPFPTTRNISKRFGALTALRDLVDCTKAIALAIESWCR